MTTLKSPQPATLTYETSGTLGMTIAFGVFVLLVFLVPTAIVSAQWLAYDGRGPEPNTGWESVIPGAAGCLYGLWRALRRDLVTIDANSRTITWTTALWSKPLRRVSWTWAEVSEIAVCENGSIKNQGFNAVVRGPRGARYLRAYFHSPRNLPREIEQTARMLGKSIQQQQ